MTATQVVNQVMNLYYATLWLLALWLNLIVAYIYVYSAKHIRGHELAHANEAAKHYDTLVVFPKAKSDTAQYYLKNEQGIREYYVTKQFYRKYLSSKLTAATCFHDGGKQGYGDDILAITKAGAYYSRNKVLRIHAILFMFDFFITYLCQYFWGVSLEDANVICLGLISSTVVSSLLVLYCFIGPIPFQLTLFKKEIERAKKEGRKVKFSVADGTKICFRKQYDAILKENNPGIFKSFEEVEAILSDIPYKATKANGHYGHL